MAALRTIVEGLLEFSGWEEQETLQALFEGFDEQQMTHEAHLSLSLAEHSGQPGVLYAHVKQQENLLFTLRRLLPACALTYPEIQQFVQTWHARGEKVTVSVQWVTHLVVGLLSPGAREALEECYCTVQQLGSEPALYLVSFLHADYYRDYSGGEYWDFDLLDDKHTLVLHSQALEFFYDKSALDICLHSLRLLSEPADVFAHSE